MRKEIKLHLLAIHMPIVIHQHSFQSAAIHVGNNLQNTNRCHDLSSQLRKVLRQTQPRKVLIKRLVDCIRVIEVRKESQHHQCSQHFPIPAADFLQHPRERQRLGNQKIVGQPCKIVCRSICELIFQHARVLWCIFPLAP